MFSGNLPKIFSPTSSECRTPLSVVPTGNSTLTLITHPQLPPSVIATNPSYFQIQLDKGKPLLVHHQESLLDKEMKATAWVQKNLLKLHKMFGVDFQGHGKEALELLKQIDAWGLNHLGQRRIVQSLVQDWKADIVCLQETKLEDNVQDIIKSACLEASGTRGGIILLWDYGKGRSYSKLERRLVWEELVHVRGLMEGPWDICGDFNLDGGTYTWFKGGNHTTASRIDRIMVSRELNNQFNNMKQSTLQRVISDHVPIALFY
ncbi:hypothetical protein H5410_049419 [Solanum commersonii]|uniref:Endonuclease/exonuclease/phosphatase domain-containing protein n=1 Tax=Solanum commersonii TaxID=4109 RepID=A0A9J5WUX5_SOLCO|nr:hypothetical protein H5410_049419 [Solanum commersonii]